MLVGMAVNRQVFICLFLPFIENNQEVVNVLTCSPIPEASHFREA